MLFFLFLDDDGGDGGFVRAKGKNEVIEERGGGCRDEAHEKTNDGGTC